MTRINRVVFCGEPSTGKSALFDRIRGEDPSTTHIPTVLSRHFTYKNPDLSTDEVQELNIWDISGDPAIRDQVSVYLWRVDVVVLFAPALSVSALQQLNRWRQLVMLVNQQEVRPQYVVVRSLTDSQPVTTEEQRFEKVIERDKHCPVVTVSARTGEGVDDLMHTLYDICRERKLHPLPRGVELHPDREGKCKC